MFTAGIGKPQEFTVCSLVRSVSKSQHLTSELLQTADLDCKCSPPFSFFVFFFFKSKLDLMC